MDEVLTALAVVLYPLWPVFAVFGFCFIVIIFKPVIERIIEGDNH